MRRLTLLLPLLLVAAALGGPSVTSAPSLVPAAAASYQPPLPVNATFYYPVEKRGSSKVHPTRPYETHDVESIRNTIDEMLYAGQQVGIYSWRGAGQFADTVFANHLRAADDSSFRWALLAESEGSGNPSSTTVRGYLNYLYSRYGTDPSYFKVGGKPVLFVYGDAKDTCNAAARWRAADNANRFYLVMKNVPSFTKCSPQPQSWYGYAPASGHFAVGSSFAISPGFNKVGESGPRLGRSVSRFASDARAMKAAKVRFKLTTTWNEWLEATGVETATEWKSGSGHGAYVDQLHAILGSAKQPPVAPGALSASVTGNSVTLSWGSTAGSTSYQVFRNGCLAATVAKPTWTDTSLTDASASYAVKSVSALGSSRRSAVKLVAAGNPSATPVSNGDRLVAIPGTRVASTANGAGIGCAGRQRGQSVFTVPDAVPDDATGLLLSVTTYQSYGTGSLQLFGVGAPVSPASAVRYFSSRASTNTTLVPIGRGRQVVLQETGNATGFYVDVIGYTAPTAGSAGIVVHDPAAQLFFDTRRGTGGVPTGPVSGVITAAVPDYVPTAATALQVRLLVTKASGAGYLTAYEGGTTKPGVFSLAYDESVTLTSSVLVPIDAAHRTISVYSSAKAQLIGGIDGWVVGSSHPLTNLPSPRRLAATAGRVSSYDVSFSTADAGRYAPLNVGIASATDYGTLSVTATTGTPAIGTISYGPQQPQSGFVWVRVPASGKVHIALSKPAVLYVDQLGLA